MTCPTCGHPLEENKLNRVAVHDCAKCGGMWFKGDELRRAKANADQWVRWADFDVFAAAEKTGEHGRRNCAECGKPMVVLEYPHSKVTVDVCPSDQGVWLDRGEFQAIVRALDELVDKISARDYEHIALHELKEIIAGGGHESRLAEMKDLMTVFRLLEMRVGVEHPKTAEAVNTLAALGL